MITHTLHQAHAQPLPATCPSPLKYQRLLRGWSQQDVADELFQRCASEGKAVGINAMMISRWECGHRTPSPLYRKHLCQLYGQTADQLGLLPVCEVRA